MRVDLAAPPPATAPLARTGNSGLQGKRVRRSTHRPAAATTRSATASPPINRHDRRAAIRTPRARHSNPHSARGTAARSPSAVSSPGGFRTPAPGVPGTDTHRAGIRNPSQTRTSSLGAARPLPPSADIGPGGQSVGQAAQFCLATYPRPPIRDPISSRPHATSFTTSSS